MPDWKKPMTQTFEFYIVDPNTWADKSRLHNVKGCDIERDAETDTLGSATLDITGTLDECYVRVYLVTRQNGVEEKIPLATLLAQPPRVAFDGKVSELSIDAYTPLIELKENNPPLGFSLLKTDRSNPDNIHVTNIMDNVYRLTRENLRAPVVSIGDTSDLDFELKEDFVADPDDTWLSFNKDLMARAKYSYAIDEMGRILFAPDQDTASLQPVWTYEDDEESILYPEVTVNRDLFGIPNAIEVVYTRDNVTMSVRVVNDDPNSPTSTVKRGREILLRDTNPSIDGTPTEEILRQYAEQRLRDESTVEYTVSYKHAYCGTRLGDCIRLNYKRGGLTDIKAKIISQSIKCTKGTPVSEKAVFSQKLWG